MKTLEEYEELIRQWGESKGIYAQSTWQKQLEKWGSERAELLYAETDKERMDAFGDQYVCLVHVRNMYDEIIKGESRVYAFAHSEDVEIAIMWRDFDGALREIGDLAELYGYEIIECVDMAVTTIFKRTGKMVNGIFEKDA